MMRQRGAAYDTEAQLDVPISSDDPLLSSSTRNRSRFIGQEIPWYRKIFFGRSCPSPPSFLLNTVLWMVIILMIIVMIITPIAIFKGWNTFSSIYDYARPRGGADETPTVDSLLNNVVLSETGVEALKKLLITVSEESDRVMLVDKKGDPLTFKIDVSGAREFGFLYKYMLNNDKFPHDRTIVDIGAYDGVLGSNSYNFLQVGWSALLVEPFKRSYDELVRNTRRFAKAVTVNVAVSDWDGEGELSLFAGDTDPVKMENTINPVNTSLGHSDKVDSLRVPVRRARSLLKEHKIAERFGILSVDAEGVGPKITADILHAGYRPNFIIFEWLGTSEKEREILKEAGYETIGLLGFNIICEYDENADRLEGS